MTEAEELIKAAEQAAAKAYAPYSEFRVGAALLTTDGRIFTGVNIENRSYGLTICAERNAAAEAIKNGATGIAAAAVFAADSASPIPPCGACRQVLSEFADKDTMVYYACPGSAITKKSLAELLPEDSLFELKKS
jgi:cytidine deaminase